MSQREKIFVESSKLSWQELGGGLRRKVLSYDDNLMMVLVEFESGGVGAIHNHPHSQMSYIESGVFEITIGEEVKILQKGDVYYAPPYILHGALCLEAGILVDVFTPMREDFV
ncbi:MAG: cupin domain-containing protein [Siphonobacter sp.]